MISFFFQKDINYCLIIGERKKLQIFFTLSIGPLYYRHIICTKDKEIGFPQVSLRFKSYEWKI